MIGRVGMLNRNKLFAALPITSLEPIRPQERLDAIGGPRTEEERS